MKRKRIYVGESTIYGGKYYAGSVDESDGFSQMTSSGFEVFNSTNDIKLRLGYTTEGEDFPLFNLVWYRSLLTLTCKFTDGLWIGNSEPADESGNFTPMIGYNGIFLDLAITPPCSKDTEMKNIYTVQRLLNLDKRWLYENLNLPTSFEEWNWTKDDDTIRAYYAISNQGYTAEFKSSVWNSLCNKLIKH